MSNYLIELSAIHLILILGYWLILRQERQYGKLRFFLIVATFLSLIIPLLKLPKLFSSVQPPIDATPIDIIPIEGITITPAAGTPNWNFEVFIWLYIAISALFLVKFLGNILYLIYLERKSHYEKFNDRYIRRVDNINGSFTFFNWIFLSNEIEKNQNDYNVILTHEVAHVSLGHTYDLLFFELFKICFWWLPTAWFVNKEIKKIHEYQADAFAIKSHSIDLYSSILISSTLKSNGLSLANSFHDGLILKRLKAMKQQTKNVNPLKLGILTILCAALLVIFACSEEKLIADKLEVISEGPEVQDVIFSVVEEQPSFAGGMDAFYKYVTNEVRYPIQARQKGVEGVVSVQFIVERDGSLSGVKAIKGIGAGCDQEAVRVLQSVPSFKPGSQRGRTVRVQMVMPITFKLKKDKVNPDNSTQGTVIIGEVDNQIAQLKVDAKYANGAWSGTIYSAEGDLLPGVNIVVEGTSRGTVSDLDGTFKVKASKLEDLNISFVGYKSVRLNSKGNAH